jgi:hypothetical protein
MRSVYMKEQRYTAGGLDRRGFHRGRRARNRIGAPGSVVPEQPPRLDAKPLRDPRDVVDRHVALRALDAAEVGPVDPTLMRECLLAETVRGAQPAHVLGQDVPQRKRQSSVASIMVQAVTTGPLTGGPMVWPRDGLMGANNDGRES